MAKKRNSAEVAVTKLRPIDVLEAQGRTVAQACKEAEVSEQSCYWALGTAAKTKPLKNRSQKNYFLRVFDDVSDSCSDSFYRLEDDMREAGIQRAANIDDGWQDRA